MRRENLGGLDWFRLPAALLVIAIHTGPLLSVNPEANFLFTDILGRLAVPFFFVVTGFFLVPRLQSEGRAALVPFCKKTLLLYAAATLLYLPLRLYSGYFGAADLPLRLVRDILFNGTFYHLWYFPAVLLGGCLVCLLVRRLGTGGSIAVCALLYLAGLLGDSYYALTAALPPLKSFYDGLFLCFDYTRNGLFFAPIFLLLGGLLARHQPGRSLRYYGAGLFLSLVALLAEGFMVAELSLARFDALYLTLPLCLYFLTRLLAGIPLDTAPGVRAAVGIVYVIHPFCIVLIRGGAGVLGLEALLVDCSPIHYLAVSALSFALALPLSALRRPRPSKTARAWLELDQDALRHNLEELGRLLPDSCALMAVVKANAYGHGELEVARTCHRSGVRAFAVATAEEGVRLRQGGIRGEILVLGRTGAEGVPLLTRYRLTQAVVSLAHAVALDRAGKKLQVHLKLDTGMHRLGLSWCDADAFTQVAALPHLRVTGTFTHLSHASGRTETDEARTKAQIQRFYQGVALMERSGLSPGALHVESSYGLLNHGPLPCAYVRVGIALYGLLSSPYDRTRLTPDLRPVLSLRARVALVHEVDAGDTAGYDGSFAPDRPSRVATLTVGYADGYPRSLSCGVGGVLIRGQYAPVAGRICMDQMLVDVTDIPGIAPGDTATLIGRDGAMVLPAPLVAEAAGTITNELLSRMGGRLARITTHSPKSRQPGSPSRTNSERDTHSNNV